MDYNKASDEIIARLSQTEDDAGVPEREYHQSSLEFAWRSLPDVFMQYWWLYLSVAVVEALIFQLPLGPRLGAVIYVVVVGLPTIVAAVRVLKPDVRWTQRAVVGLLIVYAIPFIVVNEVAATKFARTQPMLTLLFAAGYWLLLWAHIKLVAAGQLFLLNPTMSIRAALLESWNFIRGEVWWKFFGLSIVAFLPSTLLVGAIDLFFIRPFAQGLWLSTFIGYALAGVSASFYMLGIVALTQRRGA